jgi:hypothetical protein
MVPNVCLAFKARIAVRPSQDYRPDWYVGASVSLGSHSGGFGALCEDMESFLAEVTDPHAMADNDHLLQ